MRAVVDVCEQEQLQAPPVSQALSVQGRCLFSAVTLQAVLEFIRSHQSVSLHWRPGSSSIPPRLSPHTTRRHLSFHHSLLILRIITKQRGHDNQFMRGSCLDGGVMGQQSQSMTASFCEVWRDSDPEEVANRDANIINILIETINKYESEICSLDYLMFKISK